MYKNFTKYIGILLLLIMRMSMINKSNTMMLGMHVKKIIKILLMLVVSVPVLTSVTGCTSAGDLKNPLTPIGAIKKSNKETATVKFYRSSDHFGIFQFTDNTVLIDMPIELRNTFMSEDTDTSYRMETNRSFYMSKELKPGVHNFYLNRLNEQIATLEAGRTYYLSVSFLAFGLEGLSFRTKEDFLKETLESSLIEYTGKGCNIINGCPTRHVNE